MKDPLSSRITRNFRKFLGELPLFAGLAPELLDELAHGTCNVIYQKGQPIFRSGDTANQLYAVVSGQAKLSLGCRRGNERVLELIEAGQIFGQAELFVPGPYVVSAHAVKTSHVLAIRRDALFRVMGSDPRVARRVIEILARRQLETEADLIAQNSWTPGQRLLGYLLELAGPGRDATGETTVTLETSKKVLASRFDMQPETLSRNLRDLSEAGLIVVERNRVTLRNGEIERHFLTHPDPRLMDMDSVRRVCNTPRPQSQPDDAARGGASWSQCGWINGAGRQRALSQRMAKSWLMLEQGLLARQSRQILGQSVKLFDSRLRELEAQTAGTESHASWTELAKLWPRYRELLDGPPNSADAHELFAINEDVLNAADVLAGTLARSEGTRKGQLINLAGRGRMQSQRAAKFFMFRQLGIRTANCGSRLDEASEEFSKVLGQIKAAVTDSPGLTARLESSTNLWTLYRESMEMRDPAEFPHVARKVFRISEDLLNRTDAMVELCVGLPEVNDGPALVELQPG